MRTRKLALTLTSLTIGVLGACLQGTAHADDDPGPTGGGTGQGQQITIDAAARERIKQTEKISALINQTGPQSATQPRRPDDPPKPPVKKSVTRMPHIPQRNDYFCGPAAGMMILKSAYPYKSAYDGAELNQSNIGSYYHMGTWRNKVTDWGARDFTRGLNLWRGKANWYVQIPSPSAEYVRSAIVYAVHYENKPLAGSTVEFKGGDRYNGHPRNSLRHIGHWIVAFKYEQSGAVGYWADPATSVFPNAKPTFAYNTKSFHQFLKTNGIAH
jgi:hypothetical protein